jgi:hypothetical protein
MVFTLQRRIVRIIAGVKCWNLCRNLFMRLEMLPLSCEYIFTLINFVVNNQERFQTQQFTLLILGIQTTHQLPTLHAGIKVFSTQPSNLRSLGIKKGPQFKVALTSYLNTHSFYSVEEFLTFKNDS